MGDSNRLQRARQILQNVQGQRYDIETRAERAIELAGLLLDEADAIQTPSERSIQVELGRMMDDLPGKAFTTSMTDQAFRCRDYSRVADQIRFLLDKYGIPRYLSADKQIAMRAFKIFSRVLPSVLVPLTTYLVRREMARVILPGEKDQLGKHMAKRRRQNVRVNLNHLGEAILGEEEALTRLQIYLDDLAKPEVEYISVKISTICSQLNLLAWEDTLELLAERLRELYRAAQHHKYVRPDGSLVEKFVNLDMEEYRDLHLTAEVFQRVLSEPEFQQHSAGIVLQAYLPDSYPMLQQLTEWAMQRCANGGAAIKVRIVKGANLAMEQVESAQHEWPQAPYDRKIDVDANYKRMLHYGFEPEHAAAVRIGVASHNLFDLAYSLILRAERGVESQVEFEMLEGMADHMRRAVQHLSGGMLLYCPAAKKEEFQNAVAYLIRRLDENTAPDNFLRHAFHLKTGTVEWDQQVQFFKDACALVDSVSASSRRTQDRREEPDHPSPTQPFVNESDTDWALAHNRAWMEAQLSEVRHLDHGIIPLCVGGTLVNSGQVKAGYDPSEPGKTLYHYSLGSLGQAEATLRTAKEAQDRWKRTSLEERCGMLLTAAQKLRERRGRILAVMMADGGKLATEADPEFSEAVDFLEYYARSMQEHALWEGLEWRPKGTVLVTPPWNFPLAIPLGGVAASLVTGNTVIFKPASETVLVAWEAVQVLWEAGVPKEVLQFFTCEDDPVGTKLVTSPSVDSVILTGATSTARHFLTMRPDLDLHAETGGKNAIIVTKMADRDIAVRDVVQSAFGHSGQKCSACSLLICEPDVYHDPHFRQQLRDAASSLKLGSAWDLSSRVNPLIHEPGPALERGLTTLDEGEQWLLEPKRDALNPRLWSPGIKIGIRPGSFMHRTELFGPVLGVMRADDLDHAIELANATEYGLTSGIHSLDEREVRHWSQAIRAGNLYVNRGITGAVVQRQPFGGCKQSSFGRGSKAGGPNYLSQLMHADVRDLPVEKRSLTPNLELLDQLVRSAKLSEAELATWESSLASYSKVWEEHFSKDHDPTCLQGQDNFFRYVPHDHVVLRVQQDDSLLDIYRAIAGAVLTGCLIEVSHSNHKLLPLVSQADWTRLPAVQIVNESDEELCLRIQNGGIKRLRYLKDVPEDVALRVAESPSRMVVEPISACGRLELLHYLRELSLSIDYHRYGNLGDRETEQRRPLPQLKQLVNS